MLQLLHKGKNNNKMVINWKLKHQKNVTVNVTVVKSV
jgi:hypothetical protein